MRFSQICFIATITLLFLSAGYLLYLNLTMNLSKNFSIRFFTFLGQHLFSAAMLITRKLLTFRDEPSDHLRWIVCFTGLNFLLFAAVEIFAAITSEEDIVSAAEKEIVHKPLPILTYYHLYYQFNIYVGIFFLFSLVMGGIYYFNER